MSWNFMLLIFINVCQVRWIVIAYSRINYVHSPDGSFSAGVSGIIKTMHRVQSVHMHYTNAPDAARKKPDVMI